MEEKRKSMREEFTEYFSKVYSDGSIPGGILQAHRPNVSVDWDEKEDTRRSEETVDSYVKELDAAVELVATRK